jgi:hypothetical protein
MSFYTIKLSSWSASGMVLRFRNQISAIEQIEESNLKRCLNLLLENPTRGDWVSNCIDGLKE